MKATLSAILLFSFNLLFSQNDSLQKIELDGVVLETDSRLKLVPKDGKYIVNVAGTVFQETENVWEGLKQVPLLRAVDGSSVKVTNKVALVQINGIESQLNGQDLEDYLKSLDPKTIRRIEIVTNPDASHEANVSAVVNIVLLQKADNYRLGVNSTNGFRSKYYNSSNANYSVNWDKTRLYTNYSFNYLPTANTSEVTQQIGPAQPLNLNYRDNDLSRTHQAFTNLSFDVRKKDIVDLTAVLRLSEDKTVGSSYNESFEREINLGSNGSNLRFAETWKHIINDSTSLKIGSYQVFRKSDAVNFSNTNNTLENQKVKTTIPIFIAFSNYTNKNHYGVSSAGFRYNNTNVENNNFGDGRNWPFLYSEQVIAAYLNHNIPLSDTRSLDFGIRSESTIIDFSLKSSIDQQSFGDKKDYTNLLYNITYQWYNTDSGRVNSISFKKQIERPNYSYLNPFQSISNDITYFSGDYTIDPARKYTVGYETNKKEWTFYVNSGYLKDFISSFYELENQKINLKYQNFEALFYTGAGMEYYNNFFNKKWTNRVTFDISYFKLKSENHELDDTTPQVGFSTLNILELTKHLKLNINYSTSLPFRDGTLKHYFSQKLDLIVTGKINKNLSILLFAYDIFKTSINGSETIVPGYFYASKYYNDVRSVGLSLRWSITGKTFKNREIEEPSGTEIDRL